MLDDEEDSDRQEHQVGESGGGRRSPHSRDASADSAVGIDDGEPGDRHPLV
jgi:hypothetical protein